MDIDWKFYETLDDAVYVCDMETYDLEYMNRRCLQDCGLTSMDEVKGRKCYEVLQKCSSPCAICTNKYLKPGHFYEWKYSNPVLKKTYLLKDTMIERDGRRFRMELTIDVSAQERQNEMLQNYTNNEIMINEGLRIALQQPTPEQSILVLLEHLGRYLKCKRVSIFEERQERTVTNTYEWCTEGTGSEIRNLQQIPMEVFELWYQTFRKHENIIIPNLEETKESDPQAYDYLKPQGIGSLVVSPLVDHGKIIGFFGVVNASADLLDHISTLLEIIGHFMVSLMRRRDLVKRLEYLSYHDKLTGLKNRHAMDEYLTSLNAGESIGVLYLDVMGLKTINDTLGHQHGDSLLSQASACLNRNFAGSELFRIGGDEFLVLCSGIAEQDMMQQIEQLRADMQKSEVVMAMGYVWEPHYENDFERLLKEADVQMYKNKKLYYSNAKEDRRGQRRRADD